MEGDVVLKLGKRKSMCINLGTPNSMKGKRGKCIKEYICKLRRGIWVVSLGEWVVSVGRVGSRDSWCRG